MTYFHLYACRFAIVIASIFLTACGGGDAPTLKPSSQPLALQGPTGANNQFASTATSLLAPVQSEAPVLRAIPPAPQEGPPPRLPAAGPIPLDSSSKLPTGLVAPSMVRQTVLSGLKSPTDLVFATDGVLLFTDRELGLFSRLPRGEAVRVFAPKDLVTAGSNGMLALAIDPEFQRNRFVYVFMRSSTGGRESSRVVRVTIDTTFTKVGERRDILVVDTGAQTDGAGSGDSHLGGGLRFGPDGLLYVGMGDGRSAISPQSPQKLAGKVLRIDRNGQAAPSNHAPAGQDSRVIVSGLRDPVALAFHVNTEALMIGQRRSERPDDVIIAKTGSNGGWDPRCALPKTGYCDRSNEQVASPGAPDPTWRSGKPGEGLSAVERLRDPMWQGWRNSYIVAYEQAQRLDLIKLDAGGRVVQQSPTRDKFSLGFKALAQGPDGLYAVTSGKPGGEEIWRMTPY